MEVPETSSRRAVLALTFTGTVLVPRYGFANLPENVQSALDKLRAGRTAQEGRLTLRLPAIAENGNTVPLNVSAESPMTATDHVKVIHVFAIGNPTPEVAVFHLTPALGRAAVDTRIRLGQTQDVLAFAEMADGSLHMARAEVKVTIGGCGG
ncbi:MAG: thiosulfate oxidation carrier protein SoxY [Roseomonas sp.]|nr:thiosulfate oxidation carrier protein SoxY [Roseomonas sp.]MCA3328969.1 thiosulfate oxidation carrier protein SoxY [Roseomonas sp.]MCA3332037.1 thiosulfate oxidation carrier protein SoxY [Roseomonas sp.]MCA3334685.1 thiosulfate oxidation carrier protein SoxY [Roseomonas sp.]MCA3347524.1 thiosulfate oxidation carrier protein SoxY [Roseomonas sp.]